MLTHLPRLPSDFPRWSWEKSNGLATDEEMLRSYTALKNQGLCSSFSRNVWNDLVDLANKAMVDGLIVWEPEYGEAEESKINERLGQLTARRFNSVIANIDQFKFVNWKWTVYPQKAGYTGRTFFNGYSTHGRNSDLLYGWYFFELTKKLNRTIEMLTGEADFGDFEHEKYSGFISKTTAFPSHSAIFTFEEAIKSICSVHLFPAASGAMLSEAIIKSKNDLLLMSAIASFLYDEYKSISFSNSTSNSLKAESLVINSFDKTISKPFLTPLVFVGYMRIQEKEKSFAFSEISSSNSSDINSFVVEKTITNSEFSKIEPWDFRASLFSVSNNLNVIENLESYSLYATSNSKSKSLANFVFERPIISNSFSFGLSKNKSVVSKIRPFYNQIFVFSNSKSKSLIEITQKFELYSSFFSESASISYFDKISPLSAESICEIKSKCKNKVNKFLPVFLSTKDKICSYYDVDTKTLHSFLIFSDSKSFSYEKTDLKKQTPKVMLIEEESASKPLASFRKNQSKKMLLNENGTSYVGGDLDTAWYPPIQIGSVVMFQQVYDYSLKDGVLEVI